MNDDACLPPDVAARIDYLHCSYTYADAWRGYDEACDQFSRKTLEASRLLS